MNIWHIWHQSWGKYKQETGFRNVTFINIKYVFPQLTSICITIWKTHLLLVWESNEQACFIFIQIEKLIWTNRNVLEELAPSRQNKYISFKPSTEESILLNVQQPSSDLQHHKDSNQCSDPPQTVSGAHVVPPTPTCFCGSSVNIPIKAAAGGELWSGSSCLMSYRHFTRVLWAHWPRQVFWRAQVMTAVKLSTLYRGNIISNRSIWNDLRSDISRQFCGLWFMLLHGWRKLALSHDQSSQAGWFCRWLLVKLAQSSVRGLSQWWFIIWQQNEDQINHKVQKLVTLQSVVSLIPDKVLDFTSNNHSSVMY